MAERCRKFGLTILSLTKTVITYRIFREIFRGVGGLTVRVGWSCSKRSANRRGSHQ